MKAASNLKGVTKMECELKTKLNEEIKREKVYDNKMSDEEFIQYKY